METYKNMRELENANEFVYWLMLKAITKNRSLFDKMLNQRWKTGMEAIDLSLMVNGIEFPLNETIDTLREVYNEEVAKEAMKIFKEQLCGLTEQIHIFEERFVDMGDDILRALRNHANDALGVDVDIPDYV